MKYAAILFIVPAPFLTGCGPPEKVAQNKSPEKAKAESDIAYTTLRTEDATAIETKKVVVEPVQEQLALPGWITAKPGNEVTITAPVAGYIRAVGPVPIFNQTVIKGQPLFALEPVLSPLEMVQYNALKRGVESDLEKAKNTLKTAESEHKRIEKLVKDMVAQQQQLELAELKVKHAMEELAAAQDKQKYFHLDKVLITTPAAGSVLAVPVSPGQYVPAAAPLLTIIDLNPVWVRVAVPEHDYPLVDPKEPVQVMRRSKGPNGGVHATSLSGKLLAMVPQVDPIRHTADFLYELPKNDPDRPFVKDEMVTVKVPLGKKSDAAVVPDSAIYFDTHGNTWVYLDKSDPKADYRKFERRKVNLQYTDGHNAVVGLSVARDELIVVKGTAELWSREFFKTPVNPPKVTGSSK